MATNPTVQNTQTLVSKCCQAQCVTVTEKEGGTSHAECTKCKKPCDMEPKDVRSITEKQEDRMHAGLVWGTSVATDSVAFITKDMECESDYKKNLWNFIPRNINEEHRSQYGGKKFLVEFFCVDDKQVRKRLERIVKKWSGKKKVEWKNIHETEELSTPVSSSAS